MGQRLGQKQRGREHRESLKQGPESQGSWGQHSPPLCCLWPERRLEGVGCREGWALGEASYEWHGELGKMVPGGPGAQRVSNREGRSHDPVGTTPTAAHLATLLQDQRDQSGAVTPANKRCQALVSMALPQGPEGDRLPTGDLKPSEGPAGPSRTPDSPAVTRRRLLLQELEAQVQAAYGQVKWAGVWDRPHLRGP